jgi:hypothetical protein
MRMRFLQTHILFVANAATHLSAMLAPGKSQALDFGRNGMISLIVSLGYDQA